MKNKTHTFSWSLLIMLIIALLIFTFYLYYKNRHFSCESELNIIMGSSSYNVITHYTFAGGTGKYHSLGVLQENGKPVLTVNKAFDFKYSKQDGSLMLMSVDNSPEPELLDSLIPNLPDFFSFSGRGLSVRLLQVNKFSYLFFHNNEPLFYCTRTDRDWLF